MPVNIRIAKSAVVARVVGAFDAAKPLLCETIKDDCNEYCKFDNGELRSSANRHSKPELGLIIWQTPYAKRQYWEIRTAYTPGTTWRWCEYAKQNHLEQWRRQAQRLMEMNL